MIPTIPTTLRSEIGTGVLDGAMTSSDGSVAAAFADALRRLRGKAGRPTLKAIVHAAARRKPPVILKISTIGGWFNGESVPGDPSALWAVIEFLLRRAGEIPPGARDHWEKHRRAAEAESNSRRGRRTAPTVTVKDFYKHIPLPPMGTLQARTRLIEEIERLLVTESTGKGATSGPAAPVVLWGMGGVGKSVTARIICDRPSVKSRFPDGILWADAQHASGPEGQIKQWIRALGGPPTSGLRTAEEAQNVLARTTERLRCLFVIDDVRVADDLKPYLISSPMSRLLVTTRDVRAALDSGGATKRIPPMGRADALRLVRAWSRPSSATDAELREICALVGHLPLALKIAGAHLRRIPAAEWLWGYRTLEDLDLTLDTDQPARSVAASFKLSTDGMVELTRQLYFALAAFPSGETVNERLVGRLWSELGGLTSAQTTRLLSEYADQALLELNGDGARTVTYHSLIRQWMGERLLSDPDASRAAHDAVLRSYNSAPEHRTWSECADDGYLYRNLVYHLRLARRHAEIVDLFRTDAWLCARVSCAASGYNAYCNDLQVAWSMMSGRVDTVEVDMRDRFGLTMSLKYLLIESTVNSIATDYSPDVVARAVKTGYWSKGRALSIALRMAEPADEARLHTALLQLPELSAQEKDELYEFALYAAQRI